EAAVMRMPLSREDAAVAIGLLGEWRSARLAVERKDEIEMKSFVTGEKTLRWLEATFGKEPADGRSLWISLHGGGAVPQAVNNQQWLHQIKLYEPSEGIVVAPRAPTDTWDLWHEEHIDPMLARLIENYVAVRGVNPDKVYLMGYSAGGDGVWQLAPRMADRFAAAAMMAGHPNGASPDGLRNLPFAIFMGENDGAYKRNEIAVEKAAELDRLEEADPGGYIHMSRIYEGLGHWMDGKDAEALPWMERYTRNPWPKKVIWRQDDVIHERFYWLKIPDKSQAKKGDKIIATVDGQTIRLEGDVPAGIELRLSDELLDLDKEIQVTVNGRGRDPVKATRTAAMILESLEERHDVSAVAVAMIKVN
ncbi:MAG: transglutaminase domain-containing protein, partial [Luteolibacter sp.]